MASIAQILAEQGRVLAEAQRRRAFGRGMFIAEISRIPGEIMAGQQAEQQRRFEQAQAIAAGRRQVRQDERLDAEEQRRQQEFEAQQEERKQKILGSEAERIAAAGYVDVPRWIQDATGRGLFTEEQGRALFEQAHDEAGAKRIVDFIRPFKDPGPLLQRDPERDLVDPRSGRIVSPGVPRPPTLTQRDPTKDLVDPTGKVITPGVPEVPRVTYSAPQPVMVGGQRILARAGSDGALYNMRGEKIVDAKPDVAPTAGSQPGWQWVTRNGNPVHTNRPEPGDRPLREGTGPGWQWVVRGKRPVYTNEVAPDDVPMSAFQESANDRQRVTRAKAARDFLGRLDTLRTKINTRMGPAAGMAGYSRRAGAALGMDPDVSEYERIRRAAGRSLAVAIMGAQNLSDADADSWAGMLPDARTDRETALRLTTQVESMLSGMTGTTATGAADADTEETPADRAKRLYDELTK